MKPVTRSDAMESIILNKVSIGYASKHHRSVVVEDMNASLLAGELTCLVGANGAGKSTLLRTLAGFQPILSGDCLLFNRPIGDFSPRELAQKIAVVLTSKPDVSAMKVEELLGIARSPYTSFWGNLSPKDKAVVEESLTQVGIQKLRGRLFHTLSDGEKQKVMIAKALAQQTDIILLDEPTAFLDYPSKVEVLQLLRRLANDLHKTILLSTHDLELALQLADKIWLMEGEKEDKKCQLAVGTPRQLADNGLLSRFIDRDGIKLDATTLRINVVFP